MNINMPNTRLLNGNSLSFGTKLVNTRKLSYSQHSLERMYERGLSKKQVVDAIQAGTAYKTDKHNNTIVILDDKPPKGYIGSEDTIIVADKQKNKVITVYHPEDNTCAYAKGGVSQLWGGRSHYYKRIVEPKNR